MGLLNYSTKIDVARTIGEIQGLLAVAGANAVAVEYDNTRQPSAIAFDLRLGSRGYSYRLPANVAGVEAALAEQYRQGKITRNYTGHDHANRVAWRIVGDWLQAQLAIIEAQVVTLQQVFLPYLLQSDGQTLYEAWESKQLALPSGKVEK